MAAYTIDDGTQTITFTYEQDATSSSFNNLLHGLLKPGIYEGGLLSKVDDVTVSLASYTTVINADNVDSTAIRVETENAYNVTVAVATPVVVLRYEWHSQSNNFVKAVSVAPGSVTQNDVVVGVCDFVGAVLQTTFIYDDATNPREQVSKDADTILLGDSYSVSSTPTGGTASNFTGNTTFITEVLQDLYERLIDLSGVHSAGVKYRHVDLDITTGTDGADLKLGNELTYQGSAPGNIANTVAITTALQSIIDLISDLSGVNDDKVTRRLLNFGSNATQISLKDFVIGILGSQVMDGSFTDYSYAANTVINIALDSLSSIVNEIAIEVNTNTTAIAAIDARVITIEGYKFIDSLPVGTMLDYDGTNWTDNVTIPGWWACTEANYTLGFTPNLEQTFVKYQMPSEHQVVFSENFGGAATITLAQANIPEHDHSIPGLTFSGTTGAKGKHIHNYSVGVREDKTRAGSNKVQDNNTNATTEGPIDDGSGDTITGGDDGGRHTHSFSGTTTPNTSGTWGQTSPTALSINPAHYSLIKIRKVS